MVVRTLPSSFTLPTFLYSLNSFPGYLYYNLHMGNRFWNRVCLWESKGWMLSGGYRTISGLVRSRLGRPVTIRQRSQGHSHGGWPCGAASHSRWPGEGAHSVSQRLLSRCPEELGSQTWVAQQAHLDKSKSPLLNWDTEILYELNRTHLLIRYYM